MDQMVTLSEFLISQ